MTGLAGLPVYLDLLHAMGLSEQIGRHLQVKQRGWTDAQMVSSLMLLNIAGGDCVEDLGKVQKEEGFCRVLRRVEQQGMKRRERRELERRWRKEKWRSVPSPSAAFRYLSAFHDKNQEGKRDALFSYKGFKSYQPLNTWWAEQKMVLHTEFRDGNVPAGYEQLRVLKESLSLLPEGVEQVRLRSDTAGYQHSLLRYCEQGEDLRFGRIEFAVGADVTLEFKKAVLTEVTERDWQPIYGEFDSKRIQTNQEWAEVCFVPNAISHSKNAPVYRYLVIREAMGSMDLPGMPQQEFPFQTLQMDLQHYKLFGLVTNMDWDGERLIHWHRERCGKSEEAHSVMKGDFAGGQLPSGDFGENATWWWVMILAMNLNTIMKRLVLGGFWTSRCMKAIRFSFINIPGRIVERSRELIIRLVKDHPAFKLYLEARRRIMAMTPVYW